MQGQRDPISSLYEAVEAAVRECGMHPYRSSVGIRTMHAQEGGFLVTIVLTGGPDVLRWCQREHPSLPGLGPGVTVLYELRSRKTFWYEEDRQQLIEWMMRHRREDWEREVLRPEDDWEARQRQRQQQLRAPPPPPPE